MHMSPVGFWALVAGVLWLATRHFGGTPPTPLRHGGFAPLDPRLPTLVGLGFASVLGPIRGGVAGDGYSPPFKFRGGTPPHTPRHGGFAPPGPPIYPPPLAEGLPEFWAPLVGGVAGVGCSPLLKFCGGIPPTPLAMGASPPWTPLLPTPVGLGFARVLGHRRGGLESPLLRSFGHALRGLFLLSAGNSQHDAGLLQAAVRPSPQLWLRLGITALL